MTKVWDEDAWDDYIYWQTEDRKTLKRINITHIGGINEEFRRWMASYIKELKSTKKFNIYV